MIRSAPGRATSVEPVPVRGLDASAVVALDFDARGRLVGLSVKRVPPHVESAEQRAAAELAEAVGIKLRRIGDVREAVSRAQAALDFLENLAALEELRGAEAVALLAADREGRRP